MDIMKLLEEMCEKVTVAMEEANRKLKNSNGQISTTDIDYLDKLTHTLKSLSSMIMIKESKYSNGDYAYNNGNSYGRYYNSYENGYGNNSYDNGNNGNSYDGRGRTGNVRRDSMGRYATHNQESMDEIMERMYKLMDNAPNEKMRSELDSLMQKMKMM